MPPLRDCKECGKGIVLKITRDFERKWFCSKACAARFHGRSRDMSPIWAKAHTPEANAKKGHPRELHTKWLPIGSKRQTHNMGYIEVKLPDGTWEYGAPRDCRESPPVWLFTTKTRTLRTTIPCKSTIDEQYRAFTVSRTTGEETKMSPVKSAKAQRAAMHAAAQGKSTARHSQESW